MPLAYQEPLLRADQVAQYLGLSVQTLYNMRLRGRVRLHTSSVGAAVLSATSVSMLRNGWRRIGRSGHDRANKPPSTRR